MRYSWKHLSLVIIVCTVGPMAFAEPSLELGPELPVAPPFYVHVEHAIPQGAISSDEHFFVWSRWNGGIYGERVTPEGELLDPHGLFIAEPDNFNRHAVGASDGVNFLMSWMSGNRIWTRIIRGDGSVEEQRVLVDFGDDAVVNLDGPLLAWNGNNYLLVISWRPREGEAIQVSGFIIDQSGELVREFPISERLSVWSSRELLGGEGVFVLLTTTHSGAPANTYELELWRINHTGILETRRIATDDFPIRKIDGVFIDGRIELFLSSDIGVRGMTIDSSGGTLREMYSLSSDHAQVLDVLASGGDLVVPVHEQDGTAWIAVIRGDTVTVQPVVNGLRFYLSAAIGDVIIAERTLWELRNRQLVELRDIPTRTAARGQSSPVLASGRGVVVALWTESYGPDYTSLFAARFESSSEARIDDTPILIARVAGLIYQQHTAITWDGEQFLFGWKSSGQPSMVRRMRVDGSLEEPAILPAAACTPSGHDAFRLVSDGATSLASWAVSNCADGPAVYGVRIVSGVPIDSSPISLTPHRDEGHGMAYDVATDAERFLLAWRREWREHPRHPVSYVEVGVSKVSSAGIVELIATDLDAYYPSDPVLLACDGECLLLVGRNRYRIDGDAVTRLLEEGRRRAIRRPRIGSGPPPFNDLVSWQDGFVAASGDEINLLGPTGAVEETLALSLGAHRSEILLLPESDLLWITYTRVDHRPEIAGGGRAYVRRVDVSEGVASLIAKTCSDVATDEY